MVAPTISTDLGGTWTTTAFRPDIQSCSDLRAMPALLLLLQGVPVCLIRPERHVMAQVGEGKQAYDNAKDFVKDWKHMDLGWVDTNRPPVEVRRTSSSLGLTDRQTDQGITRQLALPVIAAISLS